MARREHCQWQSSEPTLALSPPPLELRSTARFPPRPNEHMSFYQA